MGQLVFAAKVTHVPSMIVCEQPGPYYGKRDDAVAGHLEIGRRLKALQVDTLIIFDTHWLVNNGYHVNAGEHFSGVFTSNEFPHLVSGLPYDFRGNPELAGAIAAKANEAGVKVFSHHIPSLDIEYGTLIPLRYEDPESRLRVVSIAAFCPWHKYEDSRIVGESVLAAIKESNSRAAILASGSMSHRIHDNRDALAGLFTISNEYYRQVDLHVLELWAAGRWSEFVAMLPEYAASCHGEGMMHDTAMLLGALGWDAYTGHAEILTDWFASSGTGQATAVLPIGG